ncbi:bacillithiol biosynthesis deacetylase BshB1 [Leptolyngbya sp. 7M]|uniref:bacillithiol biosynthesis deacetylase BshB1 n=1 Tax=Leptolyngbya sp. 7M TaxID=2812896 RepID=UPI001B8CC946|nr:bacillithiol biosynthesis deacetylase BshB1 [Leptolyngbya sp. 7M]QYO67012.1 bacillithiol biosynthesis deacetylase BshB1 [Leptolyngbya sp. 7M]
METVDILGVFAHPDDLELTVGGTMLKMKSLGYSTGALDVTRGEMGTRGTVERRSKEAEDASKILKLDLRENLRLADGRVFVDDVSRTAMVRVFRRLKPKLILTHQLDDPHPDHDHIARLVRESARLASMKNYDPETGDEKIVVPRVAHNIFSRHVLPSFVVDISPFLAEKMAAIRAHSSQFYDPNSTEPETRLTDKRFLNELENRSRYFGSLIGVEAGEPFFVREALNIEDPLELLSRPMNLYS